MIATVKSSFFEEQRKVVEAQLESAKVTLKSNQDLALMRSIGEYEVQLSEIDVKRAEAELQIAKLNTDQPLTMAKYLKFLLMSLRALKGSSH